MKNFTNVFGTEISYKPFYQTALNLWRVARFENNNLDLVVESDGQFKSQEDCQEYINKTK